MTTEKKNLKKIFIGVSIAVAIGVAILVWYLVWGKDDNGGKEDGDGGKGDGGDGSNINYCATAGILDKSKLLKIGMPRNHEVCELQRLIDVKQDGYFGVITETAVEKQFGKKEITINRVIACQQSGVCD